MPPKPRDTKVHQIIKIESIWWALVLWRFGGKKRLFRNNYLKSKLRRYTFFIANHERV